MTRFRPCIDLHAGSVKQIVGGTLTIDDAELKTNYTSEHPSAYFAQLYNKHNLRGGHVIMLGPGNESAAREALAEWPGGLQVGGGINDSNANSWVEAGAERALDGDSSKLVIDLSCRRVGDGWKVAMDRWQTITGFEINRDNIALLEPYCGEFLVHAADAEGLQAGIDEKLVSYLSKICTLPVTYAGGGRSIEDLELVERLSGGKVDLTIGSALDIFGGKGVTFDACRQWNARRLQSGG
ncbi:Enzyme that catalyzes the fourth step in the histidine pathway [Vermiconidia calcicola]|uniref:Enzyme that catalyzes the fourth step in the histidine pathway n=1 Tax=Vermiconidia calcicola TaxID=1690605 RepID=A0ACC3NGY6_9PEZI|nr:Enzyme that catalyzes the fourth step in the histidine pathway [Vermiconidia calcicola]